MLWWFACAAPDPTSATTPPPTSTDAPFVPFVDTLTESAGADDLNWHPDGFLLASDLTGAGSWPWDPSGTEILAVDPQTGETSAWGTGIPRPIGAALADDGTLYVAAYGEIAGVWAVPPGGGPGELVVDGLSYPSMVAIADDGALLVTEWGRDQVSRIVNGVAEWFADVPGAVAIDRRADGELIVSSSDRGIYHLAADGTATRWLELPDVGPTGFASIGDATYVTALDGHRVWRIDADGTLTSFVGDGEAGNRDGALDHARLTQPNGITAAPDGSALYVQQLDKRVRVIHVQ